MANGTSRYVVTLRFGSQMLRLYLRWPSSTDGEPVVRQALSDVERVTGTQARDGADFLARSRKIFADYGFEEFRP